MQNDNNRKLKKNMKNFILTLVIFFGGFTIAQAQPGGGDKEEKIEALYVAYMTKQLTLTADEAQKFWPVHAQYTNELKAISSTTNELDRQQASLNIKKKYEDRFIKILGAERTNNFFQTDGEFRKRMIDRLKKLREQRGRGNN